MKKSLSTRLMYSFMVLVAVIIAGVTIGMSYLITNHFFSNKEDELSKKGNEVAITLNYFLNKEADVFSLNRYLSSADKLIGARILLFDDNYSLIAASNTSGLDNKGQVIQNKFNDRKRLQEYFLDRRKANIEELNDLKKISTRINKSDEFSKKVALTLKEIYRGNKTKLHLFHPYYKKQVLIVGLPIISSNGSVNGGMLLVASMSGLDSFLHKIYIYTGLIGLCALLLSLGIVRGFSKRIVRPLISMKNSASAIAAGNYSMKVDIEGEDEVADLGNSLNSLSADISAYVTKLEKAEKLKCDFIANVSHELKTPITIIRGYNEALADGLVKDANLIKKYRDSINNETIRVEALVRELLDLSKLQIMDEFDFETENLSLGEIVLGVVSISRNCFAAENRELIANKIDTNLFIKGDGDRIFQLAMVFADNALKYTSCKGTITFEVYENDKNKVVFAVEDTGAGIQPEDVPYIWERFYKADKSHCRKIPGIGLGLAFAHEIARIHGAKVAVQTEVDKGTRFEVIFDKCESQEGIL